MPAQQSLIIVKPDGITKGLAGQIIRSVELAALTVVDSARIHLPRSWVEKLYALERGEEYYTEVVEWVSSASVLLLKVEGPEAISRVKWQIIGRYPEGIRGEYSENWIKNVAHAPDSEISATREIELAEEIFTRRKSMDNARLKNKMVFALTGMSECGKSTVGRYLDSRGIKRLKIVRLFEKVRDKLASGEKLEDFVSREEKKDPYALWDAFLEELLTEMDLQGVSTASIESLYGGGFGPYLMQKMGSHFCIVYIDIPFETRLQRQMQREGIPTIEGAREILVPRDEIKEKSGIPALKDIAGEIIDNSGTIEDLHRQIDSIVKKYRN